MLNRTCNVPVGRIRKVLRAGPLGPRRVVRLDSEHDLDALEDPREPASNDRGRP